MIRFTTKGHKSILATHKNTLELTKDSNLTINGDCIIGVSANFNKEELILLVKKFSSAKMILRIDDLQEIILFKTNIEFSDDVELVIRKSNFNSKRTLGFYANKASIDLSRKFIKLLKNPLSLMKVKIIGMSHR